MVTSLETMMKSYMLSRDFLRIKIPSLTVIRLQCLSITRSSVLMSRGTSNEKLWRTVLLLWSLVGKHLERFERLSQYVSFLMIAVILTMTPEESFILPRQIFRVLPHFMVFFGLSHEFPMGFNPEICTEQSLTFKLAFWRTPPLLARCDARSIRSLVGLNSEFEFFKNEC